jgi:Ca2+-binding EF-hand superfamily protein
MKKTELLISIIIKFFVIFRGNKKHEKLNYKKSETKNIKKKEKEMNSNNKVFDSKPYTQVLRQRCCFLQPTNKCKHPIIIEEKSKTKRNSYSINSDSLISLESFTPDTSESSFSCLQSDKSKSCSSKSIIITERIYERDYNYSEKLLLSNIVDDDNDFFNDTNTSETTDFYSSSSSVSFCSLNEDDIDFLLSNTGFTIDQIERWHLFFTTKCPNGFISENQFCDYYQSLLPNCQTVESKQILTQRLFNLFDIDADGRLNFSEFLVSFWIQSHAPLKEKFTWLFNMYDIDRNGYLSYHELLNALTFCDNNQDKLKYLLQLNNELNNELSIQNNNNNDKKDDQTIIHEIIIKLNKIASFNRRSLNRKISFDKSIRMVQIKRENFLELCQKFKVLRRIIMPIKSFYDEDE